MERQINVEAANRKFLDCERRPREGGRQNTMLFAFSCTEDHAEEWMQYLRTHAYRRENR